MNKMEEQERNDRMTLRYEIDCEDQRLPQLGEDCVQWQSLIFVVLNLLVLLPTS